MSTSLMLHVSQIERRATGAVRHCVLDHHRAAFECEAVASRLHALRSVGWITLFEMSTWCSAAAAEQHFTYVSANASRRGDTAHGATFAWRSGHPLCAAHHRRRARRDNVR